MRVAMQRDAEGIQPPLKKQKLNAAGGEIEEKGAEAGGNECGEDPAIMWGGLGKFLKEADVGITEYISSQPGFFAILKQRYSDFLVHEIATDGTVVRLTSLAPPPSDQEHTDIKLEDAFSTGDIEKLQSFAAKHTSEEQHIDIPAGVDKEKRTAMHKAVRRHFPHLTSTTVAVGEGGGGGGGGGGVEEGVGGRVIRVWANQATPDTRGTKWPSGRGKYLKFVLHKENRNAVEVISYISRQLGVKSSVFYAAGLKDKRAITTQQYTAFKVQAEELLALNNTLANVKVGNTEYVSKPLKLGDLSGNRFTIVLRSVSCDNDVIRERMTSLRDVGFINYFGMQRFGTSTIPTYHMGRFILHSDWNGAVDAILMPRAGEPEEVTSVRRYFMETRDAEGALKRLPGERPVEKQLLQGLVRQKDLLGALRCIPYTTRLIYVHSYQSLLWNKLASWRILKYGLQPIPGDLVLGNGDKPTILTEKTLEQYTIQDVVLPLPGYDITLPANEVGAQYAAMLAEDNLTLQKLKHNVRDFTLFGSYRHLIVKPKDVVWEVLLYDDVTIPLALTDCDTMENKPHPHSTQGGKLKALRLDFSLPSASYATMAVREVTKTDTSANYQTQLNPGSELD